jgi:recombinational DNA repair protein RecR
MDFVITHQASQEAHFNQLIVNFKKIPGAGIK